MRVFLVVMTTIVGGALLSCGSGGNDATAVNSPSSSGTGAASSSNSGSQGPQTFQPGQQIKIGDNLLLTVGPPTVKTDSGNPYITPGPGNEYLIVPVAFDNQGSAAALVSSAVSFEMRDATGQRYMETVLPDQKQPPDGSIAPKDKLAGELVYAVPAGKPYKLYFKNDLFSAGAAIIDLGTPK